jgi:MFS family permease
VAILGTGADQASSASIWSLFIALAVFGTSSNVVYAEVGGLATIAVIASLVFSSLYGVLIDRHQGGALLKVSAIGNALLHLARPFISTPVGAVLINVANEAVTSGYTMPFLKGQYDMADDLPGYRIVYMSLMQCMVGLGSALFCAVGALIVFMTDGLHGLQLCYVVAALMSLLVLRHGFPALRHSRF